MTTSPAALSIPTAEIALGRDVFMRTLIRELAGTLQDVTIASGAAGCRVTVYLQPSGEAQQAAGREYLGD